MKVVLRNIGNSKGVLIPAQMLKELGMRPGDQFDTEIDNGQLVFTPATKVSYTLAELLQSCDKKAPVPEALKGNGLTGEAI